MERNYHSANAAFVHPGELNWRTAFHEAGHAAAIHIRNQQKQLPPVFFEIQVKRSGEKGADFSAQVVDGNLIQNLPIAVVESFSAFSALEQHSCQRAYEADVVNLLVGPLAEAKYVAIRDDEAFNRNLVTLDALRNYGGHSDLEKAKYYLECFIAAKDKREAKLQELLLEAYQFIDHRQQWKCILNLAHYIMESEQEIISCDETINLFEECLRPQALAFTRTASYHLPAISF